MNKLNVVIVTYGNRWQYLRGLLSSLETEPVVRKAIVVDNASSYDVASACRGAGFGKSDVYRFDKNTGSAGGFSKGISLACEQEQGLIFLLDDDNLPAPGALKGLVETYRSVTASIGDRVMLVAYRNSQHGNLRIPVKPLLMQGSDFLGFNAFNAIQRHLKLARFEDVTPGPEYAKVAEGAPYSGMLFSAAAISEIGLPLKEMVLYFDDVEFSMRMMNAGYALWLDTENRIEDVLENYSIRAFSVPFLGFVRADSDSKIYYMIRNRVYLDYFVKKNVSFPYWVNKAIFLAVIGLLCMCTAHFPRLKAVMDACRDGSRGRLGFNDSYQI